MKRSTRTLAAIVLVAALATASGAYAENHPAPPGAPAANTEDRKAEEALMLKNRKEEMLLRISNHMKQMEKEKSCIESASTLDALHQCRMAGGPPPGMMMHGGMGGMGKEGKHGGGMMGDMAAPSPAGGDAAPHDHEDKGKR